MEKLEDDLQPSSKAARLRHYWPQVERWLEDGVSHADIVAALEKVGIEISMGAFPGFTCFTIARRAR